MSATGSAAAGSARRRGAPGARFRIPRLILALEGADAPGREALARLVRDAPAEEWDAAFALLVGHGVAPYAFHLLSRSGLLGELPGPFAARLRDHHRESQIEHFRLLGECRRLAGLFRESGVRAVPFKGAALFTTLYGSPGLRPMQDLDWLVRRPDLPRAEGVLREAGYAVPGALDADTARRLHFHLAFVKGGDGTRVELHWNLADEQLFPPARLESVWARVRETPGEPFLLLDELTALAYLCVHAFKHGALNLSLASRPDWRDLAFDPLSGNRLIWLLDIRKTLARGAEVAPEALLSLAREWGAEDAIASSLALAQHVFGAVAGWGGPARPSPQGPRGPKRLLTDLLAAGLARGDARAVAALERLQRLDHARELRLIRGLDLLDLLLPRPGEARRWRESGRGALLPLLYLYRALTGPFAIAGKALPWLRRRGRG